MRRRAAETPASFVAYDLLATDDRSMLTRRTQNDGARLVNTTAAGVAPVHLTAVTDDHALATEWFDQFEGAGPDGLVIKGADLLHRPGERVMQKVKHARTADCVLAGFRWHKSGPVVGSLLLGLYDVDGMLQQVGVVAFFTTKRRRELVDELAPLCIGDGDPHPRRGPTDADAGEGERRHPVRPAGGIPARICRSWRYGQSASSRCAATSSRAPAFCTRRSSTAGGPSANPPRAPTTSSSAPSGMPSPTCCREPPASACRPDRSRRGDHPGRHACRVLKCQTGCRHAVRSDQFRAAQPDTVGATY